jgi:hypothetical protein
LTESLGAKAGSQEKLLEEAKALRDYPAILEVSKALIADYMKGYEKALETIEKQHGTRLTVERPFKEIALEAPGVTLKAGAPGVLIHRSGQVTIRLTKAPS